MESFASFLHELELADWSPAGHIDPRVPRLLAEIGRRPALIRDIVGSWDPASLEKRQLRCHETSTHYKWFIHYHQNLRYRVWLHQYKAKDQRKRGYAEVPHNHRYSLASVILRGGFAHHSYVRDANGLAELAEACKSYVQGDAYIIEWQQIHKLADVDDHTVTLVVESPVVRHFSEAFYDDSGQPNRFYDFVELHSSLLDEMAPL